MRRLRTETSNSPQRTTVGWEAAWWTIRHLAGKRKKKHQLMKKAEECCRTLIDSGKRGLRKKMPFKEKKISKI